MKQSFRDLLNFKAIEPIVDLEPKSTDPKVVTAARNESEGNELATNKQVRVVPNDFTQKRLSHSRVVLPADVTSNKLADKMDNLWGFVNTKPGKVIKAAIKDYNGVIMKLKSVMGHKDSAYRFVKEIMDDPFGNRYYKAVKNDREETLIAAVKSHIDSFKSDYNAIKNDPYELHKVLSGNRQNADQTKKNPWDPYTYKNYANENIYVKEPRSLSEEVTQDLKAMPLPSTEAKEIGKQLKNYAKSIGEKAKAKLTSDPSGTLIFTAEAVKNAILGADEERLGRTINEFYTEQLLFNNMNSTGYSENLDYYKTYSDPYNGDRKIESPVDLLNAAKDLGFCSGYKDLSGFSLDSSHLWGITIEPYEFDGYYKSLAPQLPGYYVPVWSLDPSTNRFVWNEKFLYYGTNPPIVSYSLNIGTSMEKDISLYNGSSIKIPMGFSFNYSLTLNFVDDQHSSIKNYMNYYFNCIHRPTEGLMAPYELCSFLITITSFKPGLKVKNMLRLICVPVGYSVSQCGEGNPSMENITVGFSVVGMKTSQNWEAKVDKTLGGIWRYLSWNDIILRPVLNRPITKPPYSDRNDWRTGYGDNIKGLFSTGMELARGEFNKVQQLATDKFSTIDITNRSHRTDSANRLSDEGQKYQKKYDKLTEKGKTERRDRVQKRGEEKIQKLRKKL